MRYDTFKIMEDKDILHNTQCMEIKNIISQMSNHFCVVKDKYASIMPE